MKELIEGIARALVDQPESVDVRVVEGEGVTVFELSVAKSDMGRIIGRKGQNAQSIRTLLNAVGRRRGENIVLEIVESAPSERQ